MKPAQKRNPEMTNSQIKIGKTSYKVTSGGTSDTDYTDAVVYVKGPKGGEKCLIAFSNGCVRIISYTRGTLPRSTQDLWGEKADAIRDQICDCLDVPNWYALSNYGR